MSIIEFNSIKKFFGGGVPTQAEEKELFREVLIMTLARATSADTNTAPVEISTVQRLIKKETGEDIAEPDVRVAAASSLFETTPLEKYLARAGAKLDTADRVRVVRALAETIKSDVRISAMEVDFFNMVARAINVTPAELAGLVPEN